MFYLFHCDEILNQVQNDESLNQVQNDKKKALKFSGLFFINKKGLFFTNVNSAFC